MRKKTNSRKKNSQRFHMTLLLIYIGTIAFACGAMAKEILHLYRSPPPAKQVANAVLMVAANEVLIPDYIPNDESAELKPEDKLQYEPANDDAPILEEKHSKELTASGVEYPETKEVFITMEPSFTKKTEDIVENDSESASKEETELKEKENR